MAKPHFEERFDNVYSDQEVQIGWYIKNGVKKPVYRIMVDYTIDNNWQTIATIENVDRYINIYSTNRVSYVKPYYRDASGFFALYISTDRTRIVADSAGFIGFSDSLIIEYTKTTD